MLSHLKQMKVTVKTLASEARHTRLEEHKSLDKARIFKINAQREEDGEHDEETKEDIERSERFYNLYQNLRHRRVHQLRKAARSLQLAYGFLRGMPYADMEESCYEKPDFDRIEKIVFDYVHEDEDPRTVKQTFEEWLQLAKGIADEQDRKVA